MNNGKCFFNLLWLNSKLSEQEKLSSNIILIQYLSKQTDANLKKIKINNGHHQFGQNIL